MSESRDPRAIRDVDRSSSVDKIFRPLRTVVGDRRVRWLCFALLALTGIVMTWWAYGPGLKAGFFLDDYHNIEDVAALHWTEVSLDAFRAVLSDSLLPRRWFANTTFALNHLSGGLDPSGYHWLNLLIHLAVGVSLVWVASLYARPGPTTVATPSAAAAAGVVTLLFLLHPLNIQAVTYVVQRMSSLAALFCLCAFGCYLSGRRAATTPRAVGLYLLATVAWLLALGSKENALILPLVVATYEVSFHRGEWVQRIGRLLRGSHRWVLALSVAAAGILGYWLFSAYLGPVRLTLGEVLHGRDFTGFERILTQTRVQFFYLGLLLWPAPSRLNLEHDFSTSTTLLTPPSTVIAAIAWVIVLAIGLHLIRKRPRYGFPVIAYLLFHSIESAPVNLEMVFEHRMYLPMTALVLLLTVAITDLGEKRRSILIALVLTLSVPLAIATHRRNDLWSNHIDFHYDSARKSPRKYRPQINLGKELSKVDRVAEAIPFFRTAVELRPHSAWAHNQLGTAHLRLNELEEAYPELQTAVILEPDNAFARYNLALTLDRMGRGLEAVPHYRQFLRVPEPRLTVFRPRAEWRLRELTASQHDPE